MNKYIKYTKIALLTIILAEEVRKAMKKNNQYLGSKCSELRVTNLKRF